MLIKSIGRMFAIYNTGTKIEILALLPTADFTLKDPGSYEISVKRPALFGIISTRIPVELMEQSTGEAVVVQPFVNLLSQRKDMSGSRVVPIAEFTIDYTQNRVTGFVIILPFFFPQFYSLVAWFYLF